MTKWKRELASVVLTRTELLLDRRILKIMIEVKRELSQSSYCLQSGLDLQELNK